MLALPFRQARATEPVPGNSCTGTPGIITNSWQWAGAPENGGVFNGMFCNGSTWSGVINFQSSGYVGIGTTTPAGILDVEGGTASSGNGTSINIVAQNGKASGNTNGGNVTVTAGNGHNSGTQGYLSLQAPGGVAINASPSNFGVGYNMAIMGYQASTNGNYAIGIGAYSSAAAPNAMVFGTSSNASGVNGIALGNKACAGDCGTWNDGNGGNYSMAIGLGNPAGTNPQVKGTSSLGIFMGDQSGVAVTANNVMSIMGGKVGISTTSPQTKLDVNGTIRFAYGGELCSASTVGGLYYSSATHLMYGCLTAPTWTQIATAAGSPAAGSSTQVQFNSGGNLGGSSNLTWSGTTLAITGNLTYTGTVTDMSDRRAKDRIEPLRGELPRIMRLQPISFVMKDNPGNGTELGFIAQDAEPLFPDLVITRPDGMKALNYIGFIAPLTEAMQEQQAEINQLRLALFVVVCGGGVMLWRGRKR